MTTSDLITDLRSRINPAYALHIGTESYERRLCVEALEAQQSEIETLRLALSKARDIFSHYASLHAAKTPPDTEKAKKNQDLAQMCAEALPS